MKTAVTASGPTLNANVDPRFGRCAYFVIVDPDTLEFEALENSNAALGGGAGIQSGQLMAGKGVQFVLTGNCGPNAHATLSAAGIGVIPGCSGTVREAVEQFKAGRLSPASEPNVASHSGMGGGPFPSPDPSGPGGPAPMGGGGMGPGRGAGGGGGRGMGRGMGRGRGQGGGGMGQGRGQGGGGMGQGRGQGRGRGA